MCGCVGSPRIKNSLKKTAGKPLGGFFHAVIYYLTPTQGVEKPTPSTISKPNYSTPVLLR